MDALSVFLQQGLWTLSTFLSFLKAFEIISVVISSWLCCVLLMHVVFPSCYSSLWCSLLLPWFLSLWSTGCRAHGLQQLWHTGSVALSMWDLPRAGTELMSPASADTFLTTWPPRKFPFFILLKTEPDKWLDYLCKETPQSYKEMILKILWKIWLNQHCQLR